MTECKEIVAVPAAQESDTAVFSDVLDSKKSKTQAFSCSSAHFSLHSHSSHCSRDSHFTHKGSLLCFHHADITVWFQNRYFPCQNLLLLPNSDCNMTSD